MGLGIMLLADLTLGVGASRVEIAKGNGPQAKRRPEGSEHLLRHEFGGAVGTNRTLGRILCDGQAIRDAIGCTGARKYKLLNSMIPRGFHEGERASDIVAKIFARVGDRLADMGKTRKMHYGVRP